MTWRRIARADSRVADTRPPESRVADTVCWPDASRDCVRCALQTSDRQTPRNRAKRFTRSPGFSGFLPMFAGLRGHYPGYKHLKPDHGTLPQDRGPLALKSCWLDRRNDAALRQRSAPERTHDAEPRPLRAWRRHRAAPPKP